MGDGNQSAQKYRAHFVGAAATVYEVLEIEAPEDQAATAIAERMFEQRPSATGFSLIARGARTVTSRRR